MNGLTVSDMHPKQTSNLYNFDRKGNKHIKPKDNNDTHHTLANCQKPSPWYEENFGLYKVVALNLLPLSYSFLSCIVPSHRSLTLTEHWTFSGIANWISSHSISSGCDSGDNYCVL